MDCVKAFVIAAIIGVSGCSYLPASADLSEITSPTKFGMFSPMPFYLRGIPDGNDSFSEGWRDGCNTYMGFTGSGLLQMRGFTYDIERSLKDKPYAAGYREGANICMYYNDTRPN